MNSDESPNGMPRVGQVGERSRLVASSDIERFTEISGDRNPLHSDAEVAAASRFGEIVVQGGVSTAILNVAWDFRAPVRPGDTITGRVEVTEVRDDKPITHMKTSVTRQDGVVAVEGTAICYTFPLP